MFNPKRCANATTPGGGISVLYFDALVSVVGDVGAAGVDDDDDGSIVSLPICFSFCDFGLVVGLTLIRKPRASVGGHAIVVNRIDHDRTAVQEDDP